ncbi:TolC family protein [Peredibacter sp. HCB2-198]|uniref:TolC family protein n=1 Tax=Peredibacter sp. HCB2-198 TaxID=3383025 RepID=UPI0038B5B003
MKYRLTLSLFLMSSMASAAPMTLKDSFEAARKNMETLKRADATVARNEETENRAKATILPNISGVGSYTRIDPPTAAGNSPFLLTKQYSAALRLTQPIIRGGSISAYQMAKENVLLAKFQKEASELNLYQLVINSYYNLHIAQVDVQNLQEFLKLTKDRVRELRERTAIGRSRKGELVEAEAQEKSAESQLQAGLISLKQAEATFEFYTRMSPGEIPSLGNVPKLQMSSQEYLNKVKTRPDIMAVNQQVRVADRQIEVSRGGHFPSLDLTSNYYFDRTGVLASSEWDVGLAVVVPLYQGGGVSAAVREAVESKRIAELTSSETTRAAERDMMISYQNLSQLMVQLEAVKGAYSKAEEAYKLNKRDYQYGLVTNLDVLQSLNYFIESKRTYNTLSIMAHMNYKNLEALTGVLP